MIRATTKSAEWKKDRFCPPGPDGSAEGERSRERARGEGEGRERRELSDY